MQITADSFNKSIVHLFLILCSKLRISKFADLNFVLNVLMFVPYPQSIKSLHSNRALQGPGDQNGPKWETQFDIATAVEYFFYGNKCWKQKNCTKKFKRVGKYVATSSFLQLLNCRSPHKKDTKCHKKSRNTKKAEKIVVTGSFLQQLCHSLTSKVEVLQKLTKHFEAKGKGAKHTHVTKTTLWAGCNMATEFMGHHDFLHDDHQGLCQLRGHPWSRGRWTRRLGSEEKLQLCQCCHWGIFKITMIVMMCTDELMIIHVLLSKKFSHRSIVCEVIHKSMKDKTSIYKITTLSLAIVMIILMQRHLWFSPIVMLMMIMEMMMIMMMMMIYRSAETCLAAASGRRRSLPGRIIRFFCHEHRHSKSVKISTSALFAPKK